MSVTVNINNLSLCHKGSNGISTATVPDVCKTPTPGGPVPMPYPNVSMSSDLASGTTTVTADGGNMIAIKGSEFSRSTGDEPGTVGGIKSNVNMKASKWILYSFDVKIEGANACRLTDKKTQNNENTVDAAGEVQGVNPNTTTVYRACGKDECEQIARTGRFEVGPNSMEGKWFADSLEGAIAHGDSLHGPGNYCLVKADVPNNAPSLFKLPNLDGHGPARYLAIEDLTGVVASVV